MAKKTENKNEFDDISLEDLLKLEKASAIICKRYESATKSYDGSIINNNEYSKFKKYNDFHNLIINKMEDIVEKEITNLND